MSSLLQESESNDDNNSDQSNDSDDDDSDYVYESDDSGDDNSAKIIQPFNIYQDNQQLNLLRDEMIQKVQDILACSRDVALTFLESNKMTTDGEKMLSFLNTNQKSATNGTEKNVVGCCVCGFGTATETTDATKADNVTLSIPARVKRKGRKKGLQAVSKELKALVKSKATGSIDSPWCLTFEPTHPQDSMIFLERPKEGTLWYTANHPGYRFLISCTADYPTQAPTVTCLDTATCFHPNIDPSNGACCLNRLLVDYSPTTQLYDIMLRIDQLFHAEQASWSSALNGQASQLYAIGIKEFQDKIQSLIGTTKTTEATSETSTQHQTETKTSNNTDDEHEEDKDKEKEKEQPRELVSLSEQCGHTLCSWCWDDYLTEEIKKYGIHALNTVCPIQKCNDCLPDSILSRFGGAMYKTHGIKTHFVNQCVQNGILVRCPSPGCDLTSSSVSSTQMIKCICGNSYCFGCSNSTHTPASCIEMRAWKARQTSEDATELFMRSFVKPCPKCAEPWTKPQGCNHVKCTKCNTDFCFTCGQSHSFGGASGSFYKCNRYEKIKQAKEKKGLRTASTSAREDLDLFSHCLDGFQGAMDLVQETPDLVASAVTKFNASTSNSRFGKEHESRKTIFIDARAQIRLDSCIESLLSARRILAHSYVVFYSHKRETSTFDGNVVGLEPWSSTVSRLFEDLQESLEAECEEISITLTTLTTPYTKEDRDGSSSTATYDPDDDFTDAQAQEGEFSEEGSKKLEANALAEIARHRKNVPKDGISDFLAKMTQRCRVLDMRGKNLSSACATDGMMPEVQAESKAGHNESKSGLGEVKTKDREDSDYVSYLWCEGNDSWTPYSDVINVKLESRYQKIQQNVNQGRSHVNICSAGRKYQIYVQKTKTWNMHQKNVGTKGTRPVKRIVAKKRDLNWTCGRCTYHNTGGGVQCFQCESPRVK